MCLKCKLKCLEFFRSLRPSSPDLQIISFSMTYYGMPLLEDTTLELIHGRRYGQGFVFGEFVCFSFEEGKFTRCTCVFFQPRYGLIGLNGCGKSQLLSAISGWFLCWSV